MSTFTEAERDAGDLAKLVNENTEVTTRYGDNPKKSYPMLADEIQLNLDRLSNLYSATIYEDITTALANTVDGDYFSVISAKDNSYLDLYKNESGVAVYKKSYPSSSLVFETAEATKSVANMTQGIKKLPRNKMGLNYAVVDGEGKVMAGIDDRGSFISSHTHEQFNELDKLSKTASIAIPLGENNVIWGVSSGGKYLGYFNKSGKWVSDHDHPELESRIEALENESGGEGLSWIVDSNDSAGNGFQVFAYKDSGVEQVTIDGYDWRFPESYPNNAVRCASNYTTPDLRPHTITSEGEVIAEGGVLIQQAVTGQSLSLGSLGYIPDPNGPYEFSSGEFGRLFTPTTPVEVEGYCLMLNNGVRNDGTFLVDTKELPEIPLGESVASSYMVARFNHVKSKANGLKPRLASVISGLGGSPYSALKKGTPVYNNMLSRTSAVNSDATAKGWGHAVNTVRIIHGESQQKDGESTTTTSAYTAILREWISDYQADLMAITGQSRPPVGVLCQMNTNFDQNYEIPLAQLNAHNTYDDIVLIGPKYQYPYQDSAHMLAEGYVKIGEQEAKIEEFTAKGQKWDCLQPISAGLSGNVVTLVFNNVVDGDDLTPAPIGDLQFDTETISNPGNFGFECDDETVSITSVSLGGDGVSVDITFDSAPAAGSNILYAMQLGNAQPNNGPRGNLKDSDGRTLSRFDGEAIQNFSVAFKIEIN